MKLLILAILLSPCLLLSAPVQTKEAHATGSPSVAATLTSTPTVGNVLIVGVLTGANSAAFASFVDDNQTTSNGYVEIRSSSGTGGVQSSIWCVDVAVASGTFIVTAHQPANSFITILVAEYSGYTCKIDKSDSATGTTSPYSCGTITTLNANDLLVTVINVNASGTVGYTAPTGYTIQVSNTNGSFQSGSFADRVVSATETSTPTWTVDKNATSFCALSSVKATTSSGSGGGSIVTP